MQLVTFIRDDAQRLGALAHRANQEVVIDLNRANPQLRSDMIAFLHGGDESHALAEQALAAPPPEAVLERGAVHLIAPVPRPGKIICIGLNYGDHAAESNQPVLARRVNRRAGCSPVRWCG